MELLRNVWSGRLDLPFLLNCLGYGAGSIGVEVGTQYGQFSAYILANWAGKLIVVDPWRPVEGFGGIDNGDEGWQEEIRRLAHCELNEHGSGRWAEMRTTSLDAAHVLSLLGSRFSFVYLDAMHDYASVKHDIAAWWRLIEPNGLLCGHDWVVDGYHNWHDPINALAPTEPAVSIFGVRRAVEEFSTQQGLPVYVTDEGNDSGWQSWMIRKPGPDGSVSPLPSKGGG